MLKTKHIVPIILIIVANISYAQSVRQIRIIQANTLEGSENRYEKIRKLIGNVIIEHEGMLLYCDSAYHFESQNYFDAYGNVKIRQPDGLTIKGGALHYDLKTKMAYITRGVKLIDNNITLTTPSIDYQMDTKSGHFTQGGKIVDGDNVLTSNTGYYYSEKQQLLFKNNVILANPDYILKADSLGYIIDEHKALFIAPTTITGKDSKIYCESGWYNTKTKQSEFQKNATIISGSRIISGDKILYDNTTKESKVIGNVKFTDTVEKTQISGKYSVRSDFDKSTVVTDSALFIKYMPDDTLYLHADTLKLIQIKSDSNEKDMIVAWYHVKGFSNSFRLKCDSMTYDGRDSTINFFKTPVLWTDQNQITSKKLSFYTQNNEIYKMVLDGDAFMAEQLDSIRFNQVKGRLMTGLFENNELYDVVTEGNAESIYFLTDDNDLYVGRNNIQSGKIRISLKDKKISKITFINLPGGTVETPQKMDDKDAFLNGFYWRGEEKPLNVTDIFKQ